MSIEENLPSVEKAKGQLNTNILAQLFLTLVVVGVTALFELLILPHVSGFFGTLLTVVFVVILLIGALTLITGISQAAKYNVPTEMSGRKKFTVFVQVLIALLCVAGCVGMFLLNGYIYSVGYKSGDYSEMTCMDCGKPADGGYWKAQEESNNEYYCLQHFEFHKEALERVQQESNCRDDFGHDWAVAYTIAEDAVKAQLKAPASANFSNKNDTSISVHNNVWVVKGWVDAQNSFGATLRNNYTVQITFTDAEHYSVDFCYIR